MAQGVKKTTMNGNDAHSIFEPSSSVCTAFCLIVFCHVTSAGACDPETGLMIDVRTTGARRWGGNVPARTSQRW